MTSSPSQIISLLPCRSSHRIVYPVSRSFTHATDLSEGSAPRPRAPLSPCKMIGQKTKRAGTTSHGTTDLFHTIPDSMEYSRKNIYISKQMGKSAASYIDNRPGRSSNTRGPPLRARPPGPSPLSPNQTGHNDNNNHNHKARHNDHIPLLITLPPPEPLRRGQQVGSPRRPGRRPPYSATEQILEDEGLPPVRQGEFWNGSILWDGAFYGPRPRGDGDDHLRRRAGHAGGPSGRTLSLALALLRRRQRRRRRLIVAM